LPTGNPAKLGPDGHQEIWFLIDTQEVQDPSQTQQEYHLRTSTEERYRQLKCFSDLTYFTSRTLSMVVNQVVFIMLAYNLLQIYLLSQGRKELNRRNVFARHFEQGDLWL
jgi:hypothetical protein